MTPAARLAAAIELLGTILGGPRPADSVASAYFRQRRFIGAKDRAGVAGLVYGALRHHARLGWWLGHLGHPSLDARARLIAYQRLIGGQAGDAVRTLFGGGGYAAPPLDAAETRLLARLDGRTPLHPDMPPAVRRECPDWAWPGLEGVYGPETGAVLDGLTVEAALDLRVNRLKLRRDQALAALADQGIEAVPTPLSPLGLRVAGRPALGGQALFRDGAIEIQDEGSQLAALLADVAPGHQVADFCAGAGGKSLAMAAQMDGKGRVVAADVSAGRLKRARERLRRAGVDNIEPRLLDGEADRWVKRQKRKFDRVLVDAPCSGSGAWRRNPDARWRPVDLAALTALQDRILASASRLTRPGGRLVYVTCSLLGAENEERVAAFLDGHPDFSVLPVDRVWRRVVDAEPPATALAGPFLRLTPAWHGTDGFFVAVLQRADDL